MNDLAAEPRVMTDQADQALRDDPYIGREAPLGAVILAGVGWLFALIALLAMLWPVDPSTPTVTGPHLQRFTITIANEPTIALAARIFTNAGIYVIVVAGLTFIMAGLLRGERSALRGLAAVGALGLMYSAGMALYTGPMVAVFGFTIMLFSALIGLGASLDVVSMKIKRGVTPDTLLTADAPPIEPIATENTQNTEPDTDLMDLAGTDDHAEYPTP